MIIIIDECYKKGGNLVSQKVVLTLLIMALVLSVTAVYITVIKFNEASITGQVAKPSTVGVYVPPVRPANVGVTVLPSEEKGGEK